MPYRYSRHYTLAEARAILPKVRRWLVHLHDSNWRYNETSRKLARLHRHGDDLGGDLVNEWVICFVEIIELSVRFHKHQILIKDLDRGLVDFLSLRDGEEVFLCWELAEEDIKFWHPLDSGYAGRQPVEE